jgi:hypothetical protein
MGALSWLGWAALGWLTIGLLISSVILSGLISEPARGSDLWNGLTWGQFIGGPVMGNIIVRRLVHAGWVWQHTRPNGTA